MWAGERVMRVFVLFQGLGVMLAMVVAHLASSVRLSGPFRVALEVVED